MALSNNLSLKSEALFMQFQNSDYGISQLPSVRFTDRDQAWVGRIGLNYKFGGRDTAEPDRLDVRNFVCHLRCPG